MSSGGLLKRLEELLEQLKEDIGNPNIPLSKGYYDFKEVLTGELVDAIKEFVKQVEEQRYNSRYRGITPKDELELFKELFGGVE